MNEFKGRHFDKDIILTDVRWYCKFDLSLRDVEELLQERSVFIDHTTIYRWNITYIPKIKKLSNHIRTTNDSWRMDETNIKVEGEWDNCTEQSIQTVIQLIFILVRKEIPKLLEHSLKKL